jgi:DNA-binding NarL/FixJ family response regulator
VPNMTSRLDTVPGAEGILLVGDRQEPAPGLELSARMRPRLDFCQPDVGTLRRTLAARRPLWLVVGHVADEAAVQVLVTTAWQMYPDLKLAMLGPLDDLRRCERWLRRGCHVYLPDSTPFGTMLTAIDGATAMDVMVVDRAFYAAGAHRRHAGLAPSLTARQHEVLGLLGRDLTNAEIAAALHVSENTIEFHVRRLLDKLGARNRMQAVRRASELALI